MTDHVVGIGATIVPRTAACIIALTKQSATAGHGLMRFDRANARSEKKIMTHCE